MADFASIFSRKASEVEAPSAAPMGWYELRVKDLPEGREVTTKNGEVPIVTYPLTMITPVDVPPEEFEEWGGQQKLEGRNAKMDFWADEDSLWRLVKFLTEDLKAGDGSMSIGELNEAAVGLSFWCMGTHVEGKSGTFLNFDPKNAVAVGSEL